MINTLRKLTGNSNCLLNELLKHTLYLLEMFECWKWYSNIFSALDLMLLNIEKKLFVFMRLQSYYSPSYLL